MAGIGAIVGLLGTGLQFVGQMQQASIAKAQANYQAKLAEQQAKEKQAIQAKKAEDEKLQGQLAESRAIALAAASGAGGIETPSVADTIGDIHERAYENMLAQLYSGEAARNYGDAQASLYRSKGKAAATQGMIGATGSLVSGMSNFYG